MRKAKLVAVLVLSVLVVVIVFQNRAPVETRLLFFTIVMPRAILLLLTAAVGFILGVLSALLATGQLKRKPKETVTEGAGDF